MQKEKIELTQADRDRFLDMATEFAKVLIPTVQNSSMTLDDVMSTASIMAKSFIEASKRL